MFRLEVRKIVERLLLCLYEASAGALLLDDQHSLPEKIDEAALIAKTFDRFLECSDLAALHPEDIEEIVIEGLGLAAFVAGLSSPSRISRRARVLRWY